MELKIIIKEKKILYTNYLLDKYKPDYTIIWETWLNSKPTLINTEYEIFQTAFSKFQGVWIIAKKNTVNKVYLNDKQYIIAIESRRKEHIHFVIGVYFKHKIKHEILNQEANLIKRIRRTYRLPEIIMFWDLNPDLNFTHELIEKTLNLKTCIQNKIMITREQNRLGSTVESTLDFFFSTQQFESIEKLDKFDSDHYPIISKLKISDKTTKIKKI